MSNLIITLMVQEWKPGDVQMVDVPVPDITEPDDVIVKFTGATICGSDLHLYHGEILQLEKGDMYCADVFLSHLILKNN